MTTTVYVVANAESFQEIVDWLTANVGPLLNSRPIVEWTGRGWHMEHAGLAHIVSSVFAPNTKYKRRYKIEIEDENLALICALRFQ